MIENIEEAKELLQKYRSITLEEINAVYDKLNFKTGNNAIHSITGFGTIHTCILCKKLKQEALPKCHACVWRSFSTNENDDLYCLGLYPYSIKEDPVRDTYNKIRNSKSPEELLDCIKLRADLLEEAIEASELFNKEKENENRRK